MSETGQTSGERRRPWQRPVVRAAAAVAVTVAISVPATAFALIAFTDVPPGHPFEQPITAVASAGITTGYGNGTFRPGGDVKRQEMAAFLERGLGRVASDSAIGDVNDDLPANAGGEESNSVVTSVSLDAGAAGGGGGFVTVQGAVTVYTSNETQCPCRIRALITDESGNELSTSQYETLANVPQDNGWVTASMSPMTTVGLGADEVGTYQVRLRVLDANLATLLYEADMSAIYVPFDGTGTGYSPPAP